MSARRPRTLSSTSSSFFATVLTVTITEAHFKPHLFGTFSPSNLLNRCLEFSTEAARMSPCCPFFFFASSWLAKILHWEVYSSIELSTHKIVTEFTNFSTNTWSKAPVPRVRRLGEILSHNKKLGGLTVCTAGTRFLGSTLYHTRF